MSKKAFLSVLLIALIVFGGLRLVESLQIKEWNAYAVSSGDDWTMFRHDPSHSGCATGKNQTDSGRLLWVYPTYRMVYSSPAVANGCVFIGSRDGFVYCLSATYGELFWKYWIKSEIWSSPAIYNGYVYVGAEDGYVYALNMTTGTPAWKSEIGGRVWSSPAIADGCVYIGSGDHDVYALNASDGAIIWSFPTPYRVQSSPAVSDGVVYIGTDNYNLYALNASTGREIWHAHTGVTISSPSVYNGYVYIGSVDGYVYCLNASTGAKIWEYPTENAVSSSPAVAYGCVYVGSEDKNVYSLNASTGEKIWQRQTGFWVESSPAVADGNVYVGSEDYNIYCLDASTGEVKWSYATWNYVESSPAIVDGFLYVGSYDWHIYAFALDGSTDESMSSEFANSLAWTTVAFDTIASAIAVLVVFVIARFVRSTWRGKRKAEPTTVSIKYLSWLSAHKDAVFVLAILAFSAFFFVNIGSEPLWIADERTYAQWAFHMIKNGDYLNPWAAGEFSFYIAKPPLNMWFMSLAYQVFGINNFSMRIWSALFGDLSLIAVFYLGKKLYNSYVGFLSAIVLGTFTSFFVLARHAMTDVPFVFFSLVSIYFFVQSEKTENFTRFAVLGGLFFGLALMTRQVAALLIPLIIFVYLVLTNRSIRFLFSKRFVLFLGIGLGVFSPWLMYMILSFGRDFWQPYFFQSVIMRSVAPVEGHFGDYLFYLSNFVHNENFLWVILLPFAAGASAIKGISKRSKADLLTLVWMLTVLLVFSLAQTKIYFYLLPAFPAFAIAIGSLLYQLLKKASTFFHLMMQENLGKDPFLGVPHF